MCGPVDYDALQTCISRVVELSAAGLTTYALHRTVRYFEKSRKEKAEQPRTCLAIETTDLGVEVEYAGFNPR